MATDGRNDPNSHAEYTVQFGIRFFQPLTEWLIERRPASARGRILDFGCADLRLARALDGIWVIDGWDEWASAREAARRTAAQLGEPGVVFERLEDVPTDHYDVIVLNSLFQYVAGEDQARELFAQVGPLLARDASVGIVINDAVSDGASRVVDLWDIARMAIRTQGPIEGPRFVRRAIKSGKPSVRHFNDEATLTRAAASVGLVLTRHPRNLSTFTRRATFILRHAEG